MQAGKRAAHSARTIAGNQAANARYRRVSRLSDAPSGGGCAPVMFVLFVAALGVGGYFAYKKFAPKERELPKIIDVSDSVRTPAAEEKPKEEPKKPEMRFTMQLPCQVPAHSIIRRSVELSAK
jgi:hypothetical protein